jgi:hypothetical protein
VDYASNDGDALGGWVYGPLVVTGGPMEQVPLLADASLPAPVAQTANALASTQLTAPLQITTPGSAAAVDSAPLPDPALAPLRPILSP